MPLRRCRSSRPSPAPPAAGLALRQKNRRRLQSLRLVAALEAVAQSLLRRVYRSLDLLESRVRQRRRRPYQPPQVHARHGKRTRRLGDAAPAVDKRALDGPSIERTRRRGDRRTAGHAHRSTPSRAATSALRSDACNEVRLSRTRPLRGRSLAGPPSSCFRNRSIRARRASPFSAGVPLSMRYRSPRRSKQRRHNGRSCHRNSRAKPAHSGQTYQAHWPPLGKVRCTTRISRRSASAPSPNATRTLAMAAVTSPLARNREMLGEAGQSSTNNLGCMGPR